jgi:caffeoyl-CoA O-methyltransferase
MTDSPKSFFLTPDIHDYLLAHAAPVDEVQQFLIDETRAKLPANASMQISPEQGAFMTLFTRLLNVALAVEIGTFTGYSSLSIARGLAESGRLICCDISDEFTSIARIGWERAGLTDRIDLRIAPAVETLRAMPTDDAIDLAFIDADKVSYPLYYEELLPRLRQNGVILVDNTLWSGRITQVADQDADTVALRNFNDLVAADERVESTILTLGDGLTLIRKK